MTQQTRRNTMNNVNTQYLTLWYRCRKFVFEMLLDRGYKITDTSINEPCESFVERFLNKPCTEMVMQTTHTVTQDPLLVFFLFMTTKKNKSKEIEYQQNVKISNELSNYVLSTLRGNKVMHAVVVYEGQLSSIAEKTLYQSPERIDCFERPRLMFNITKHEFVPIHIRLDSKQKQEVLDSLKVKEACLPVISVRDPVSRWYGYKRGELIKIKRDSETGGSYIYYRLCK